jgi:hypothetical protein
MKSELSLRIVAALALSAFTALLSGCASCDLKIDSIARSEALREGMSFAIRNNNPEIASDSLRFQEAARHIATALSGHGFWQAPASVTPDMVVDIDYGSAPSRVAFDTLYSAGAPMTAEDAAASTDPEEVFIPVVLHEKHLSVVCRENKPAAEGKPPQELCRVDVAIEDESHDLRAALPVLASAVMEYLGENTKGTVAVANPSPDAISFVKKGLE